jgi:hypothetical protein
MSGKVLLVAAALYWSSFAQAQNSTVSEGPEWRSLFNGRDLAGWTIKIAKHALNENYRNTFRVEDGVIKVAYENYGRFDEQFGHLYSNAAYSHYILRLDYKITGKAVPDSPSWAKLNSGVMIQSLKRRLSFSRIFGAPQLGCSRFNPRISVSTWKGSRFACR